MTDKKQLTSKAICDKGDSFDCGYHSWAKEKHKERVAKNPDRLKYAEQVLSNNLIPFKICNVSTTQINVYINGKIYTFYAGTGKIQGYNRIRGINSFVKLCKSKMIKSEVKQ